MEVAKDLHPKLIGKVKMKTIRLKSNFKRILKLYLITRFIFKGAKIDLIQVEEVRFNKVNIMAVV
jgi:hypothetical protein